MPGPAQRAVYENLSRPRVKVSQDLVQEDRFVAIGGDVHAGRLAAPKSLAMRWSVGQNRLVVVC
jgi:hypothetical protein